MDDRNQSRVVFHVNASIEYDGHTVNGDVENLSIKGIFINTAEKIPVDTDVDISIYLSGTTSELSLKINGVIVRNESKGVAVNFKEIEFDSFIHLRNIIEFNSVNDSEMMKEFKKTQS
ncbi:MAG TPA: PilZ domain-containing protein [Spirochaetota bacterium]|nr:PilZ domain-containing protein [Spirochaetota bacterium]HPS85180.1 PilZ domain-containing protein [Spirochaetota bacterium]